jgi:16S rRNA processing protein RimM
MRLEFIEAGEIVTTHGVRGEVKVLPWGDSPDFLLDFQRVRIAGADYKVESCRVQKTCNLLKLQGIDTVEAGMALRGKTLEVYREDTDPDLIFAAELIGVTVFEDGQELGKITQVLDYPGNKVYVVKGQHEYMIPAVKAFILQTNMDEETMQVKTIEGMRTDEG